MAGIFAASSMKMQRLPSLELVREVELEPYMYFSCSQERDRRWRQSAIACSSSSVAECYADRPFHPFSSTAFSSAPVGSTKPPRSMCASKKRRKARSDRRPSGFHLHRRLRLQRVSLTGTRARPIMAFQVGKAEPCVESRAVCGNQPSRLLHGEARRDHDVGAGVLH